MGNMAVWLLERCRWRTTYLQHLEDVKANVVVGELRVQNSEIRVVHVFEDQSSDFGLQMAMISIRELGRAKTMWTRLRVVDNIQQADDVCPTRQILQDFDLTVYFLVRPLLEDFDSACLMRLKIGAFENLRVPAAVNLLQELVFV